MRLDAVSTRPVGRLRERGSRPVFEKLSAYAGRIHDQL